MKPISMLRLVSDPRRYPIVPAASANKDGPFDLLLVGDRVLSRMM